MDWIEIADAWVNKGNGNVNLSTIEVGDFVHFYPDNDNYVEGRVNAVPHTTLTNLEIFKQITVL